MNELPWKFLRKENFRVVVVTVIEIGLVKLQRNLLELKVHIRRNEDLL